VLADSRAVGPFGTRTRPSTPILNATVSAGEDVVVSGDEHFLGLALERPNTVTARAFLDITPTVDADAPAGDSSQVDRSRPDKRALSHWPV